MVQITRSFTWEEFRADFIYDWIEMLRVLDEYNDAAGTARLLWMLVMYAFAVVLFVTACSLMLIFYRRVDPRHPGMKPQRLTFRELFLDLKSTGETGFFERRTRLLDDLGQPKSTETTGDQTPAPPKPEPVEKSEVIPIVASTTPLQTLARTVQHVSAETTPAPTSAERVPEKIASQEKVDKQRKGPKPTITRTQGSSERHSKERSKSQEPAPKDRGESTRKTVAIKERKTQEQLSKEHPESTRKPLASKERTDQTKVRSKEPVKEKSKKKYKEGTKHSKEQAKKSKEQTKKSKEQIKETSKEHSKKHSQDDIASTVPTVPSVPTQSTIAKTSTVSAKGTKDSVQKAK